MPQRAAQIERLEGELSTLKLEYDEFVSAMSHDFQTPFRQIQGFASIISCNQNLQLDDKTKQHVEYIMQGTQVCQQQMRALTDYSRIHHDRSEHVPVDCEEVLNKSRILLKKKELESDAIIRVNRLPTVMGNAHQIGLVFFHLLDNALKFQPAGGQPVIDITATRDRHIWNMVVSDNGIGIPEAQLSRVTGVLQRAVQKDEFPGQGMGLAIFKKIISRHHGTINIESIQGLGTKMGFSLQAVR
ncbi:MAG: ATP-binding protein [Rickettsiales bacterium]|nr:ATP-binding protein [Rickettsiales bacterium]